MSPTASTNKKSKLQQDTGVPQPVGSASLLGNAPGYDIVATTLTQPPPPPPPPQPTSGDMPPATGEKERTRKKPIRRTLKETERQDDANWIKENEDKNDQLLRDGWCVFPSWQIVSNKWVRVEYKFGSGATSIILEQCPNKKNCFTGIKLSIDQWTRLQMLIPCIQEYIRCSETGTYWNTISAFWRHDLKESASPDGTYGAQQVRIHLSDMIYVTITSADASNTEGSYVDIREYTYGGGETWTDLQLIPKRAGLTLVGGGFDFLVRKLVPKVDSALQMYCEMYDAGKHSYRHCFAGDTIDHVWDDSDGILTHM